METMDIGFFTDEQLFIFFCQNKTKMSTIEEPLMFLRHLKDNRLIKDELYNTTKDDGVYCALEHIEKNGKKNVRRFWRCVSQEHILQRYSLLDEVTKALMNSLESQPNKKRRERAEDQGTGKEEEVKKRRTESHSVSDQAGPSSQSSSTTDKDTRRDLPSPPDSSPKEDLWNIHNKKSRWLKHIVK
ncbi:uncharacterized protein si:dkey-68o6.8 [Puntigrus tetrazona]|uniref:uncharacterized protein si:dkey-68o6.8 n=1 Tax=Puntigrus tetrazona TaxID=1606681 RepID=UPI001C89CFCC|nr:uncharacterized protein si:dkey-68o6.8 [Puntigrus tetrazona]